MPIPSPVQSLLVDDINRDGLNELVFATYAVGNGLKENGMDDLTSYVGALMTGGRLCWVAALGGQLNGQSIAIADLDQDSTEDIAAAMFTAWEHRPDKGAVRSLWHPRSEVVVQATADLDGNGASEVVVTTANRELLVLDRKLAVLCRYPLPNGNYQTSAFVCDVTGDGLNDIVLVTDTVTLLVPR